MSIVDLSQMKRIRIIASEKSYTERRSILGADCDTASQLHFWEGLKLPFIYIIGRLFDAAGHKKAQSVAAILRDSHMNGEVPLARFSIEGSTVKREGQELKETVARNVAITLRPCNRSAISGVVFDSFHDESKDISKSENTIGYFGAYYNPIVNEFELIKAIEAGSYNAAPGSLTQGAALQVEHRREGDMVKTQIKAAFRDWDPASGKDLKKHLKEKLPEVDDEYLDHFIDLIGYYRLKKSLDDAQHIVPQEVVAPSVHKRKEFIFSKIAADFFGLGDHVPTVSQNLISDGNIDHDIFPMSGFPVNQFSGAQREALENVLQDGTLDKLILMDCIMGSDRGPLDFIMAYEAPWIALVCNDSWGQANTPSKARFFNLIEDKALHPAAIMWLQGLDEKKLEKMLKQNKVEPRIVQDCVGRLTSLKEGLQCRDCGNAGKFFKTIETFNMDSLQHPGPSDLNEPR